MEIASPADNTAFKSPASITVTTRRTETNRELASATLYANGTPLDVQTNAPFSFDLSLVEPGPYSLWLEIVDTNGVLTRSRSVTIVVRPTHDNFEDAHSITGYRTNGVTSNRSATLHGDITYGSNQGGHSVWYRWVAPADGVCTINANGEGFFAVLINVCVGSTVWSLSSLANNAGPPGPVSFQAVRGTVYHISLDGYFSEEGIISWSLALRPQNDHFAQRAWVNTAHYEAIVSIAGASLEPNETRLSGSNAVASLWYSWAPPVSASATISVAASNLLSRIAVFTGDTVSSLEQVAHSGETFSASPNLSFFAVEGTQYQIGLFCSSSVTNELRLLLTQHVPRIVSPAEGATLPAPARVTLAAQFDNATNSGEMRFYVNDALLASTVSPPYTFVWHNIGAGTYRIRAVWASGGQTHSTLPTTILVYSNNIVPTPRIFAGAFGKYSYVINAVGSLSMLGSGHSQFGITDTGASYHPRSAVGPAAVRRWSAIGAGSRGISVFETNVWSWGLTEDGRLYRNGTDLIATPPGVTRWRDVVAASGNCYALGDDGKLYLGGTTLLDVAVQGIPWKKVAVEQEISQQKSFATLSTHGVAYVHGGGNYGQPLNVQLQFPPGVTQWIDVQSTVYTETHQFWFLGDDQQLYTSDGEQIRKMPPPLGVQRWIKYAAGGFHVLAIGDNGQLYAWGRNWEGQLGTGGQPIQAETFVKVSLPPGVTAWSAVAAGYMHSVAIGNDCALYSWGNNDAGQLGIGQVLQQARPVRVPNVGVLCGTPVVRTEGAATRLQDGSIRLRFSSDLNRSYLIQYSDDLTVWKTSVPAVLGTGGLVEWIDAGPPKTDAHPNSVPSRIYRIVFAP